MQRNNTMATRCKCYYCNWIILLSVRVREHSRKESRLSFILKCLTGKSPEKLLWRQRGDGLKLTSTWRETVDRHAISGSDRRSPGRLHAGRFVSGQPLTRLGDASLHFRVDNVRGDGAARPVRQPGGPGAVWRHVQRRPGGAGEGVRLGLLGALLPPELARRQVACKQTHTSVLPLCVHSPVHLTRVVAAQSWLPGRCWWTWSPKWSSSASAGPQSPAGGATEKRHTSARNKALETTGPTGRRAPSAPHSVLLTVVFTLWPLSAPGQVGRVENRVGTKNGSPTSVY